MVKSMSLENKVAIITGASSGFGRALAIRLAKRSTKLILGDIDVKDGQELAKELNQDKQEPIAHFVQCDVTIHAQLASLFTAAQDKFGRLDIVINNAGIVEHLPLHMDEEGAWQKVIQIDLVAVVEGTRLGIEALRKQAHGEGGVIVNTASVAGLHPFPLAPTYTAAKHGVVGLTRSFKGVEVDGLKIRVNAIAPTFADTRIIAPIREWVQTQMPLVPVEQVIDAFMMAIEDRGLEGDVLHITPNGGIQVLGRETKGRPPVKL
ncbi:hypothetical protein BGZ74_008692 [Mortierella antarctica]|nr:hypothetical protein BGZ74_008692 [Mortierella antarctica]